MKRPNRLIILWSLATAGLITLFWWIWYLIAGSVPIVTSYVLGISRWWDILLGPIFSTIIVLLLTHPSAKQGDKKDLIKDLLIGVGGGLFIYLIVSLFSLEYGLKLSTTFMTFCGLSFGLIFALVLGLFHDPFDGLGYELMFGKVYDLMIILGIYLAFCLIFGSIFALLLGVGYCLGLLIRPIFSSKFWIKIGRCILDKN